MNGTVMPGWEPERMEKVKELFELYKDIDEEKTGSMSFLMVITKDSLAYQRPDGVYVVPLGCLKN